MAWCVRAELERQVNRILSDNNVTVDPIDKAIFEFGLVSSHQEIIQRLRKRGYTLAQILTWARLKEYDQDIATWFTINRMAFRRGDEEDWTIFFDRREELDEAALFDDNGDLIDPAAGPSDNLPFQVFDLEAINITLGQEP